MKYLINMFRGFCMALADSVPGVSGGTIAFVLGFYDKFINSLNDLIYGNNKERKKAIFFLLKLGMGWIIGFVIAALVLTSLFEKEIYKISSLFLGFIIFSIPLILKEEKKCLKKNYFNSIYIIIGIVIVALITYFNPISSSSNVINVSDLNIGLALYIILAGMVAISAMVLPGISGSTLLLIFGLYMPIMEAVKEVIKLNLSYLPALIMFIIGVILGIVLIIKLIKMCLEKHRGATVYLIIGLMLGSLYAIVMGPTTLEVPVAALSLKTFSIIFFIIGGIIIFGLEKLKDFLAKKNIKE